MTRKRIVYQTAEKSVNIELLSEELHLALGTVFVGAETHQGRLRVALHSPEKADAITAEQIIEAHNPTALSQGQQVYQQISDLINGAVGKKVTELNTPEQWAVLAGLLYQGKAIDQNMVVRPPHTWIARQDMTHDD